MKLILDQVNRGLIARGLGQAWFAPAGLHISKVVRGQVLANIVQPVRIAIGDRIRNPLVIAIRAEWGKVQPAGRTQLKAWTHARLMRELIPDSAFTVRPAHPAFRYYGGKWRIAPWIIAQFPTHRHYVEAFAGAASVLLRKQPSTLETLNDLNGDVVNFFRVLRDHPDELVDKIRLTPWSRVEFLNAFELAQCPVERARRWWVIHSQGVAAAPRTTGWRHTKDRSSRMFEFAERERCLQNLRTIARRLTKVQIECLPALEVIKAYDSPDTLCYVDPPYVAETRGQTKCYAIEWTDDDHRQLAEVLRKVKGTVVLSGYRCNLYDELYSGWTRKGKRAGGNSGSSRTECLWLSPRI